MEINISVRSQWPSSTVEYRRGRPLWSGRNIHFRFVSSLYVLVMLTRGLDDASSVLGKCLSVLLPFFLLKSVLENIKHRIIRKMWILYCWKKSPIFSEKYINTCTSFPFRASCINFVNFSLLLTDRNNSRLITVWVSFTNICCPPLWDRRLHACLSCSRPGFDPRSGQVSWVRRFSGFFLICKTNVRKLGPQGLRISFSHHYHHHSSFITGANDLRCWRALKPQIYIHTYQHLLKIWLTCVNQKLNKIDSFKTQKQLKNKTILQTNKDKSKFHKYTYHSLFMHKFQKI